MREFQPRGELIRAKAARYQLPPELLGAVVCQESRGHQAAVRIEQGFHARNLAHKTRQELSGFVPPNDGPPWLPSLEDEKLLRATSFGLGQLLGETARSILGFKGQYLTELQDPDLNLEFCAKYLRLLLDRFKNLPQNQAVIHALLGYNGGGDPDYPAKVFKWIDGPDFKELMQDERSGGN